MAEDYLLVDESAKINLTHDWSSYYLAQGDAITSRVWTISPMNVGSPVTPILTGDTGDIVFVEGLQKGKVYRLVETITTTVGIVDSRTVVLRCDDS